MALIQNEYGERRLMMPSQGVAGILMAAELSHTFTEAFTAASDILEIGSIPAGCKVASAVLIGTGLGAITADVGIMTGSPGNDFEDDGTPREMTTDLLFDAVSVNDAENAAATKLCLSMPVADTDQALGVVVSGNITAGAAKTLQVFLTYFQP